MTNDFEVHNIGTFQELKLSRALARANDKNIDSIPDEVLQEYFELRSLYQRQIEEGVM